MAGKRYACPDMFPRKNFRVRLSRLTPVSLARQCFVIVPSVVKYFAVDQASTISQAIREGMCFVSGAVLKSSGSNCSADGNRVTIRICWLLTSRWINEAATFTYRYGPSSCSPRSRRDFYNRAFLPWIAPQASRSSLQERSFHS